MPQEEIFERAPSGESSETQDQPENPSRGGEHVSTPQEHIFETSETQDKPEDPSRGGEHEPQHLPDETSETQDQREDPSRGGEREPQHLPGESSETHDKPEDPSHGGEHAKMPQEHIFETSETHDKPEDLSRGGEHAKMPQEHIFERAPRGESSETQDKLEYTSRGGEHAPLPQEHISEPSETQDQPEDPSRGGEHAPLPQEHISEPSETHDKPEDPSRGGEREPRHFPDEILFQILHDIPKDSPTAQRTYAACALVSKQWYFCTTPFLYACPRLDGRNYAPFVTTICPSINRHVRKSHLAPLVYVLDLGAVVYPGRQSVTPRLLVRVNEHLETFRAPQASLALNCVPALGKCMELQDLDLSLVSERPPVLELFCALARLDGLRVLRLPRSSSFGASREAHWDVSPASLTWPPHLTTLTLSGGIDMNFVYGIMAFPSTLTDLTIEHCPNIGSWDIAQLLLTAIRPLPALTRLKVAHMPRLYPRSLDRVLVYVPQLEEFSVGIEYVSHRALPMSSGPCSLTYLRQTTSMEEFALMRKYIAHDDYPAPHLRVFEMTDAVDGKAMSLGEMLSPCCFVRAMDHGHFPDLRQVRVARRLGWADADDLLEGTERLVTLLEEQVAKGDPNAGVWIIDWTDRDSERAAGGPNGGVLVID